LPVALIRLVVAIGPNLGAGRTEQDLGGLGYYSSGTTCTLTRIAAGSGTRTFIASVGIIPGTWGDVPGNWAASDPVTYPST
jgi:hypothetical protein